MQLRLRSWCDRHLWSSIQVATKRYSILSVSIHNISEYNNRKSSSSVSYRYVVAPLLL